MQVSRSRSDATTMGADGNFLTGTAIIVYDDAPDDIKRVVAECGYRCHGEGLSMKTTKEAR